MFTELIFFGMPGFSIQMWEVTMQFKNRGIQCNLRTSAMQFKNKGTGCDLRTEENDAI